MDWRDAADLTGLEWPLGAFAPGNYMAVCHGCGDHVAGIDKRALLCLRCAIEALRDNRVSFERAFRIQAWNAAKARGLCDHDAITEVTEAVAKLIRDSDRDREAGETRSGSVGEADRARAEGIAQPSSPHSPSEDS